MTSSEKPGKPLSGLGLRQFIQRALERGFIREAFHSEHERAARNISDEDIRFGLEQSDWVLAKPPDYDERHRTWEYLIGTKDIEGEELHIKIGVYLGEGRLVVVTKY